MLVVYRKISEDELRKSAEENIPLLEKWFEDNPKRRVCRAELWYGRTQSIKRKDVRGQILAIVEGLIKENK